MACKSQLLNKWNQKSSRLHNRKHWNCACEPLWTIMKWIFLGFLIEMALTWHQFHASGFDLRPLKLAATALWLHVELQQLHVFQRHRWSQFPCWKNQSCSWRRSHENVLQIVKNHVQTRCYPLHWIGKNAKCTAISTTKTTCRNLKPTKFHYSILKSTKSRSK